MSTRPRRIVGRVVMALLVVVLLIAAFKGMRWVSLSPSVQSDEPIPTRPQTVMTAGADLSADPPIEDWDDPKHPLVITTHAIAEGRQPILRVVHEEGHDGWQFYDDVEPLTEPVVLLKLKILEIDPTVAQLKALPAGWQATRKSQDADWEKTPMHASE